MIEVIGVKFKSGGKMYYFAPGNLNPAEGSYVVVETARGPECGEVAARRHAVQDESITAPLKPILRLATDEDMQILEKNRAYMTEAFHICQERIEARNLPMHLVDVECGFDSNKLIFYFTAESRVDFRELVKDHVLSVRRKLWSFWISVRQLFPLISRQTTFPLFSGYLTKVKECWQKTAKGQRMLGQLQQIPYLCTRHRDDVVNNNVLLILLVVL